MLDTDLSRENHIHTYLEQYIEKIFYFCLKKTGKEQEAEDLTSDISLCVFAELSRGVIPEYFSAWVWRIAKNRYSVWADKKRRKSTMVSGADIDDFELSDNKIIENEYVRSEELSLLRRELAFISSNYREIVVAYYVYDKSIRDIAQTLQLTEGTVKMRLLRARNILKEGMSMARVFGKMSYCPEDIGFIMNGIAGKYGEPLTIFNHKLVKNILLAAYRTPSTAKELAIELGVALPYMEDELEKLVSETLLRKNCKKYETNIVIVSAKAQEDIYLNLKEITSALTNAVIELLEYDMACKEKNGSQWNEGYQSYEDAKWTLLMQTVDKVKEGILNEYKKTIVNLPVVKLGKFGHTIRPNGGEWDLLGLEEYTGEHPAFVGLHGCIDASNYEKKVIDFGQFKFQYKNIADKTPMHISYEEAQALIYAAEGNTTDVKKAVLDNLVKYGYLKKEGETYIPTFLIMRKRKNKIRTSEQEAEYNRLLNRAVKIGFSHYAFCRGIVCSEIPDFFKDDQYQIDHACANIYDIRGAVLEEALRKGYISYSENDARKMLGAYLII